MGDFDEPVVDHRISIGGSGQVPPVTHNVGIFEEPAADIFPTLLGLTAETDPLLRLRYRFDMNSRFKSQFREFLLLDSSSECPLIMLLLHENHA